MPRLMKAADRRCVATLILLFILTVAVAPVAVAAEWPAWRADAMRSGATTDALSQDLHLQWVREFPALEPAWPDEPRMRFDVAYEPIVAGGTLFVASPRADRVSAFDAASGEHRWDFFAGGPVRFAPTVREGRVFFGSDDGYLYCVDAADGSLRWKFQACPSDRLVLGNTRLISTWPVRGAPVVADGTVYFAAGIWPFMGVFIYALDAETGSVVWVNDGQGAAYTDQPHGGAIAFGSVAPQGYMAVSGDRLVISNGRATPAVFDRNTGEMRYFHLADNQKIGDSVVSVTSELFFNDGHAYPLATGEPSAAMGLAPVHSGEAVYTVEDGKVVAWASTGAEEEKYQDSKGAERTRLKLRSLWRSDVVAGRVHALAGNTLLCSDGSRISALKLSDTEPRAQEVWSEELPDEPEAMAVADGRLFVSTLAGRLLCYGPEEVEARSYALEPPAEAPLNEEASRAAAILEQTGVRDGYAVCLGVRSGRLIEALVRQSQLHVIGIDADEALIDRLRRRLDASGLYG